MNKKILLLLFLVLLFFAGIIALTQELDFILPDFDQEEITEAVSDWVRPARWYRSNAGGMPLEEHHSKLAALRNEYALAVIFAHNDELPEFLAPYYEDDYNLEIRALYSNGEQIKTQWLFKDKKGITRLNAVFLEKHAVEIIEKIEIVDIIDEINLDNDDFFDMEDMLNETIQIREEIIEIAEISEEKEINILDDEFNEIEIAAEEPQEEEENTAVISLNIEDRTGFIELFDENSVLTAEYRFFEDGTKNKTEYEVKDNLLISSVFYIWENNSKRGYKKAYTDFFRYNRSLSLRSVERIFHIDMHMSYNQVYVSFKRNLMDSAKVDLFISERLNLYPDYFGDVYFFSDSRMIIETDERSRIVKQTLYDEDGEIIWVIVNAWSNNRITATSKKEGDEILLAEYQYNASGDRIAERNYRNGSLERLVRTEGKIDIEELYMNNTLVLRAEWADGIMISETRILN